VILEALSATGLRSIRYAKEIPLVKSACSVRPVLLGTKSHPIRRYVIANDLSPSATAAMKRNVEINGLGPSPDPEDVAHSKTAKNLDERKPDHKQKLGMVRINEGDAWYVPFTSHVDLWPM
jgi:tRNA (guanine26-N2/guanine27-N2)-dimethyltransferase